MTNKKITESQTSKIKNMTSTQGNVKVSILRGNKEKTLINSHNTGTLDFCNYLRDTLIAADDVYYRRPGYIIPCKKENGALVELFNNGVYMLSIRKALSTELDDETTQSGAVLTFKIQGDLIPKGVSIAGFKLLNSEKASDRKKYAEIDITNIDGIDYSFTVDADTDIKVSWTLIITYQGGLF